MSDNTKAHLEEITRNSFARKSICEVDGEFIVVGKWCRAAYIGEGDWDVWVCNHQNLAKGLGTRKLNNIYTAIRDLCADTGPLQKLDGEGYYPAMPAETFLLAAPVLGVRKRGKGKGNIDAIWGAAC